LIWLANRVNIINAMSEKVQKPFKRLGQLLKSWRDNLHESLAEAAGAVEIDQSVLEKFEQGFQRPPEDVMVSLISHFNLSGDESSKAWDLAGYNQEKPKSLGGIMDAIDSNKSVMVVLPVGTQTLYTDTAQVTVNDYGVVMNFMQSGGSGGQSVPIARVGMSREHAESLIDLLQRSLHPTPQTPKALPAPKNQKNPN
jgi:hypothetical protein